MLWVESYPGLVATREWSRPRAPPEHRVTNPDPAPVTAASPMGATWRGVGESRPTSIADLAELTKPRITRLVTITTAMGFGMACAPALRGASGADWLGALGVLAVTSVGTALSASGASALNEWWERDRDALMRRTAGRPIPARRISPGVGLCVGLGLCALGVAVLGLAVNWGAAMVSAFTILTYVVLYTPLKPVTSLATLIGAIPGALPPLIGWAAASPAPLHGLHEPGGWSMVAIMAVWQIPHFLAIAWMHKEDYARGGHKVLPVLEETGARTAFVTLVWTLLLLPVSLAPVAAMPGRLGWGYAAAAVVLGMGFLALACRLALRRTRGDARALFFASIIYLPLLLTAMVADAAWRMVS